MFFLGRYEKVLPYLSSCYLHALRSPITNARAGGAYLNLFSHHKYCIRFRSVVVITSALPNIDWQSRLGLPGLIHFRIFLLLGWLAVTILKKKVASSSLAETNFLIFNFSFSSLESKNYIRKTDMCFVFLGKDPTGKTFFISFVK